MQNFHDDEIDENGPPSKSRRKRDMHDLQRLGAELLEFTADKLARLPLSPALKTALAEYQRLPNSRGARRRQMQFIGRLMREADYPAIIAAVERLEVNKLEANHLDRKLEALCDRILQEGDPAIQDALDGNSRLARQTLRQYFLEHARADAAQQASLRRKLKKLLADNAD